MKNTRVIGGICGGVGLVFSLCCSGFAQASLPTTEQFHALLMGCAIGAKIDINADMLGSITSIYAGDKTHGKSTIHSESKFLELMPEQDRLKAYELYTKCIKDIIAPQKESKKVSTYIHTDPGQLALILQNPNVNEIFAASTLRSPILAEMLKQWLVTATGITEPLMEEIMQETVDGFAGKYLPNRTCTVPDGTPIDRLNDSATILGATWEKIQVLDGKCAGKIGWVNEKAIHYR